MAMKKIKYPSKDFFNYGGIEESKKIDDETIEKWINCAVIDIKKQLEERI